MAKDDDNFDPWAAPSSKAGKKKAASGRPAGAPVDPDLDEIIQKLKQTSKDIFGTKKTGSSNDGGNFDMPPANGKGVAFLAIAGLFLYFVSSSIFVVETGEEAVVMRFGKFDRVEGDGLNIKLPAPFETAIVRNIEQVREISIGQTEDESLMVTSDENIANVEFTLQWKISDIKNFVFEIRDAEASVQRIAESAMREVIANSTIAETLGEGEGRTKITEDAAKIMQAMLDHYKTGIKVVGIQLKKIDVPTQVVDAQIDVQNAKTEQERLKNQAQAYRNEIIPRARGEASKILQEAEGYKQTVIAKAQGDASRFLAVYNEYKNAKDVTRERIYLDTMQDVLSGMDKVIMDSGQGVVPYLPLPELKKNVDQNSEVQ